MKINKKVKKTVIVDQTQNILCNMCGESCAVGNHGGNWDNKKKEYIRGTDPVDNVYSGLLEQEVHGGYDSKVLADMTSYKLSLCEGCLKNLFSKFKLSVEIKVYYKEGLINETRSETPTI